MAKNETKNPAKEDAKKEEVVAGLPVTVHAQYIRDLSFENPNAPESLRAGKGAPEMDLNIGMDARKITDSDIKDLYEVVLSVRAEAKRGGNPMFVAEVLYGVAVSIGTDVPEDRHHPLLLIEIPRLAFPFVRQILSDLTSQGGFPPLMLNPVDFHALYMQRFGAEIAAASGGNPPIA